MARRGACAVMVLSIVAGTIVVLSPAAQAAKLLEAYKSNTKELKSECADGGGDYVASSKSGRFGTCMWPDGTNTTCDNKKKGKNCSTFGRVVTNDGEFLDFVDAVLTDQVSATVTPAEDTASGRSPKKLTQRLLAKEDFTMTMERLERICTHAMKADLISRTDGSLAVCMGHSSTLFCEQKEGKNCTIEAIKKRTRGMMRLLRDALVDPSSVTIIVGPSGAAPGTQAPPSTTTTEPPAATTTSTSSTTTTTGPAFL